MSTRFLTWEMLIMPGSSGADNKVEGICLGFHPVLALFSLCIYFFNLSWRVHILHAGGAYASTWNQALGREQPSNEHVRLGLAEVKAHVGGRWRRLRRRRRGPRRVDRAAGPCVMCQFASVPPLCCRCWNAGKALVYWMRSHVNSSCQHVISPSDKERGFLLTHIWFLGTAKRFSGVVLLPGCVSGSPLVTPLFSDRLYRFSTCFVKVYGLQFKCTKSRFFFRK